MKKLIAVIVLLFSVNAFASISFIDHTGKRVTLEKVPEKVVVLNSSNLEIFYAVGGKPVAYAESSTMPEYIKKKVKNIPSVGKVNNPDIEKIVKMRPELVIGMNFPFHITIRDSIEAAGIKTAMFSAGNLAETAEVLEIFGRITGNKEQADVTWQKMSEKLDAVEDNLFVAERKKVLIVYGSPESFNMALPESVIGQIVMLAGGENIAAGQKSSTGGVSRGFLPVSLEYAIMKDPDYVFMITHQDIVSPSADKSLLKHPAWKALRAVQENRVVKLPFETYGINPTVRFGDAVEQLHKIMYAEQRK
jgi:iron complex transport system substrate-binding protein